MQVYAGNGEFMFEASTHQGPLCQNGIIILAIIKSGMHENIKRNKFMPVGGFSRVTDNFPTQYQSHSSYIF